MLEDPSVSVKAAAFTQHPRPAYSDRTSTGLPEAMGYSVRTAGGRYTEWREWETGRLVGVEFYSHGPDEPELSNLAAASADTSELRAARRALHGLFPPGVPPCKR